jgi:hypothetical protein
MLKWIASEKHAVMEGGNAVRKANMGANMGAQKGKVGRDWRYFTISNKYEICGQFADSYFSPCETV